MNTFWRLASTANLLLVMLVGGSAYGVETIIYDDYNATPNSTGFAFQKGINAGIIDGGPTRLTGTLITVDNRNLRYINTGKKPGSVYSINPSGERARIEQDNSAGQFTLSTGSAAFNFASAIGSGSATPGNPVVYDVAITMSNSDDGTAKVSFGMATTAPAADPNTVGNDTWDFGIQIYRAASGDANNTIGKLVDSASSGVSDIKAPIETTTVPMGNLIAFLIRVTDAGSESGANYHSRVQVSRNGGSTWIYDTATDTALPNGFRFDGATRYFSWDQAQYVKISNYDDFSVKVYTSKWNGGGTGDNWNTAANWSSGVAPSTTVGEELTFAGSTRLTPNMSVDYSLQGLQFASGAGSFTLGATAGKTLTLNGDIQQKAANAQTLNTPISIASTRTVNTASGNLTIGGAIAGAGGLTKSGNYTLTLGGANSYSGTTTVSAGTLLVNGSIGSGAVTVAEDATLGGSGTIGGSVTVDSEGTLAPGDNAVGTLTLGGPSVINGTLAVELQKDGSGNLSADKLALGDQDITLNGALVVSQSGEGTLANGDSFILLETTGARNISPSSISLPSLPAGLSWDTSTLATGGILEVYDFTVNAVAFSTPKNAPAEIAVGKLAVQATSSRGSPAVASVGSAGHGTVGFSGGVITYTPDPDYLGPDSFSCTFSDGHGSQVAIISVTVGGDDAVSPNVVYGPMMTNVSGTTYFLVRFAGVPDYEYTVEYADGLPPVDSWHKFGASNHKAPNVGDPHPFGVGVFEVLDSLGSASRVYRTVYPAY